MNKIISLLNDFNKNRDWEQFHSAENLAKSVAIEAGELLECFQWDDEYDLKHLSEEIADVYIYLLLLSQKVGIDLETVVLEKIEKNESKYQIDKSKGNSKKYTEL